MISPVFAKFAVYFRVTGQSDTPFCQLKHPVCAHKLMNVGSSLLAVSPAYAPPCVSYVWSTTAWLKWATDLQVVQEATFATALRSSVEGVLPQTLERVIRR
jgi:hypothetical protein